MKDYFLVIRRSAFLDEILSEETPAAPTPTARGNRVEISRAGLFCDVCARARRGVYLGTKSSDPFRSFLLRHA